MLDNCEHVLDAAASVVAELLVVASPEFSVLATSRAPLGLVGEVVHRLPALPDDEALALLEARVRAGGAAPAWRPDRALALCHRLDNLPLALELAAARLRHMPLDDVLAGLGDRFALLDGALRGLPERHAGLWAMVGWSRDLLAPAEQDLLARLAVIPAPFTTELAMATAGGTDVRRGLSILVEQSLLRWEEGRYRMLETVREHGEATLAAPGGGERGAGSGRVAAMAGLVGWGVRLAVTLGADLTGPGQVEALRRCAADQDNLVAALRWARDQDDEPAAVDIATALLHLWTVRGRHVEASAWAGLLLHVDDPAARLRSAILHGRATGRPLPDADRLAWLCVLIGINAGSTGPLRLTVLARRALRTLLAERRGQVSPRNAALAAAMPGLEQADPDRSLADATTLIAHSDPYVQGMGFFFRAVLTENGGTRHDAELAYRRFEAAGDHWGMGMAAHAAGHATDAEEWLSRSERHLELVGADQDARATRVLLDIQLALAGDTDAERRLRETAGPDPADETDACQALLGLAHLAWQRGQPHEALAQAEALSRAIDTAAPPLTLFRIAVAVLQLWVAGADSPATEALRKARAEVLTANDRPLFGAWAMGGAELAAFRGCTATAGELWALGTRVGTNVSQFFPQGRGERLVAALGDRREPLLARAGGLKGPAAHARITALMDDLLTHRGDR